LIPNWYFKR